MLVFRPVEMCGMTQRIDVGVDAQRDARARALRPGDAVDAIELPCRFGVDRLDAKRDRALELVPRLADAGEHDLGRNEAGPEGHVDFAARVRVGLRANPAKQTDDGERRVGLEGIVQDVRHPGKRAVQVVVALAHGLGAVDVERRAMRLGQRGSGDTIDMETEMVVIEAGQGLAIGADSVPTAVVFDSFSKSRLL